MEEIYIFLCIFLIFLFILTERVRIIVKKDETFSLEFHFVFIAICFKKSEHESDGSGLSPRFYARLFSRLSELAEACEVKIERITLPTDSDNFSRTTLTRPFRYHSAVSAAIAYLTAKAKRLTLDDNAIILASDSNVPFGFYLIAKTSLFNLLRASASLLFHIIKHRKRRKKKENVGN